ncbi:MAG: hypothetical protein COT71_00145 [Candidatus Andersenbacteria bacterium CG10_big_fil_rev_8_21_14_0_10_54_11]|uniref:LytR family transcriptional regulator n=1 Tax=Candidatus Andersenbacteria bacterium CG10_big_fil_rev_8_21_14_0_10_54_11 TaxID=1974485 RepID=A0A2M6X0E2_9BACT|nr:MAG: hypothetical protein COT71_00145 [Candidatus Andersenbacteria bacterium CG10_big_fil_rev_8_21_14_0_10_54_11]
MKSVSDTQNAHKKALLSVRRRHGIAAARSSIGNRRRPGGGRNDGGIPPAAPPPSTAIPLLPGKRSRRLRRIVAATVVIAAAAAGIFGYKVIAASDKISVAERSILGQVKDLLLGSREQLAGEADGRINVLLIAIGGEGHKGENLADTVMVASIRPQDNSAALLSIPRDLLVQVPGEEYSSKINAVHAYGESQKKNNGPVVLGKLVEEIIGQPIHYYVRVDFTAFKNIIDAIGGVDIAIPNSFFDYWHKISFPAGTERMNGERALAYVRARYVEGPEGGDFKRAARQQQVLLALRDKVFSVQTALDFTKANTILNSLSDNIRTNMELWEMKRFYELARLLTDNNVKSTVLTTGPRGVLVGETMVLSGSPAAILKPRTGDYSEIQTIAQNIFDIGTTPSPAAANSTPADESVAELKPEPTREPAETPIAKPTVELRNGTNITGLAARWQDRLKSNGYTVSSIGNAAQRDRENTAVYTIDSAAEAAAADIASRFSGNAENGLPESESPSNAAILILLGRDADK